MSIRLVAYVRGKAKKKKKKNETKIVVRQPLNKRTHAADISYTCLLLSSSSSSSTSLFILW